MDRRPGRVSVLVDRQVLGLLLCASCLPTKCLDNNASSQFYPYPAMKQVWLAPQLTEPCPADRGKVRRLWVTAPAWHVLRFQQAGPILKKHGLALTYLVFVLSQYLGRVLTRAPGVRSRRLNQRLSCQSPLDDPPLDRPLITSSFVNSSPNNSNSSSLSLSPPQL